MNNIIIHAITTGTTPKALLSMFDSYLDNELDRLEMEALLFSDADKEDCIFGVGCISPLPLSPRCRVKFGSEPL